MRIASLVFATVPFAVVAVFMALISQAKGFDGLGYFLILMMGTPILFLFSVTSTVLAYKETANLRLDRTAKVLSAISACLFGVATAMVIMGFVGSQL